MSVACVECGEGLDPERALAVAPGEYRCAPACRIEVEFFAEVVCSAHKRCSPGSTRCATPPCRDRHYTINGERSVDGQEIVSVTTVTKEIGDKFGQGAWWGMTTACEGIWQLGDFSYDSGEDLVELLKQNKLTVHHVRDSAAQRGTDVHKLAEDWANGKGLPLGDGYAAALRSFIETEKVQPIEAEILLGSREGAYAGQSDLLARFPKLDAVGLVDFKSKTKPPKGKPSAFEQHHLQLRGYMEAMVEMGYPIRPEFGCVVNLYPDGTYALIQGRASARQWWDALRAYRSLSELRRTLSEAAA